MTVRGSIDVVTGHDVGGWAYAAGRGAPVAVQVVLGHEVLGEALANISRPDLAAAGLGDGRCGYVVQLYREIDPLYLPFLAVKVDGGDAELPRSGIAGFQEFFTALYRAHPACGRTRSVLGGLWTDRIDAPALLRGKLGIGQIAPEPAAAVGQLLQDGFAVIAMHNGAAADAWGEATPAQIGALLDDAAVLPVLRAVLEDQVLVVAADMVRAGVTGLAQPSAANPSPSPAECLAVVVAFGDGVMLDVVRDSHQLPEFTPGGASRWGRDVAPVALELAAAHGLLDSYPLPPGTLAVIGAGLSHRVRCTDGADAMRLLCLPARLMPLALATDTARRETARDSGTRICL